MTPTHQPFRNTLVVMALALLLAIPSVTSACPLCKDAVPMEDAENGEAPEATRAARGYAMSILVMLAVPFLMTAFGALVLVGAYRRNLARQSAHNPEENIAIEDHSPRE